MGPLVVGRMSYNLWGKCLVLRVRKNVSSNPFKHHLCHKTIQLGFLFLYLSPHSHMFSFTSFHFISPFSLSMYLIFCLQFSPETLRLNFITTCYLMYWWYANRDVFLVLVSSSNQLLYVLFPCNSSSPLLADIVCFGPVHIHPHKKCFVPLSNRYENSPWGPDVLVGTPLDVWLWYYL